MSASDDEQFDALLDYLKRSRGFDFTGYKRPSIRRRMNMRLQAVKAESFGDYVDYLEVHPDEFHNLFNTILINVTSFFRDEEAWETLAADVIHRIIESKMPDGLIRVWCAGVASGEEAYTIAMLLAEALGVEQFQQRVKIYATDMDEDALNQARQAVYTQKQVEPVPHELLKKYFEQTEGRYAFRKDLRRSVIFGRHDLIQDAPISRVDLLLCRNTLMYFNAEAQSKILLHFHFALNDDGILFLGKSEMLLTHTNVFTPLDLKHRIFTKVPRERMGDNLLVIANAGSGEVADHIREAAFDTGPAAQMVADQNGFLVLANARARTLFGINVRDIGRPFSDLEVSYRPAELRSRIEEAYAERRLIYLKDVEWNIGSGEKRYLDIQIMPLISTGGDLMGVTITCTDVTVNRHLQEELERSRHELETAYEELQSTNEELETTNEELQSTNEELETLNEELQSTNEELETMNEELQSANEELETVNEEMRGRTDELNRTNDFLESILTGVRVGVMVIDPNLRIREWNRKAEDLWGLRADEVEGQHFLGLDIGLPMDPLKQPVRACLGGENDYHELMLPATNRRGKAIECKVSCTPLMSKSDGIRGAIVLMEERDAQKPS